MFRKIPLTIKLLLIGLLPLTLLAFLSFQFYKEKSKQVGLLKNYLERIHQSTNLSRLINELQKERRSSYAYILDKKDYQILIEQRPKTDAAMAVLETPDNKQLAGFANYTFLHDLSSMRLRIDSSNISPDGVSQFFTNSIVRLNMLSVVTGGNNSFLQPVYQDLASEQVLAQMVTYLGVLRTNVYNALLTKNNLSETLLRNQSEHELYHSFETEFFEKAEPEDLAHYKELVKESALNPTITYLDTLFKRNVFDSTYDAETWWNLSTKGTDALRTFQEHLLASVEQRMNAIYQREKDKEEQTLLLLLIAFFVVFLVVSLTILSISKMLLELRQAAKKLARGGTDIQLNHFPADAIGSLAESIKKIDQNNKVLAQATDAIGKGEFNTPVKARSGEDLLGNAIVRMKDNLEKITQERMESREQLKQLADFVPQMVWTARPDGFIDYYNKKWYEFTGFEEGYGDHSWIPILHPDDAQKCLDTWYQSVHSGAPYSIEYRFKDYRSDSYKWFLGKALPVKDGDGNIVKWIGSCTEIQDQKMIAEDLEQMVKERTRDLENSNAELERSNNDLEQFAYVASHDLQEPVRKIRTFAEIIKERSSSKMDEPSKNYIDKICTSAERMRNIIKDILNFSHLNKDKKAFVPTDLNKIIEDVRADLELIITQKKATIIVDKLPVIEALAIQMTQLFYNLINNALKFSTPENDPHLTIHLQKLTDDELGLLNKKNAPSEYVKISFTDNGIGFEQKYAEQIFTMFQRLNDRQAYSGTGIGLALCKKIIENHHGIIEAQSAPGKGSTFIIILPAKQLH